MLPPRTEERRDGRPRVDVYEDGEGEERLHDEVQNRTAELEDGRVRRGRVVAESITQEREQVYRDENSTHWVKLARVLVATSEVMQTGAPHRCWAQG
jgi:hypothetical protein